MQQLVFKITLPLKVSFNSSYAGMHWSKRKQLADIFHSEFLDKQKLKVEAYPVWISYEYHFVKSPLDSLNTALMSKMLEDGMVRAGILKSDAYNFVHASQLSTKKDEIYKKDTVIIKINSIE